jgi:CRISPR system Cascade subunit CasC
MPKFIQLHLLTSYPPANLNRDDLGRPKTAEMGGRQRLRISSQCLKRTWRDSTLFEEALAGHIGTRTKEMGPQIVERLMEGDRTENQARDAAHAIADVFGDLEGRTKSKQKDKDCQHSQLVHYSPEEQNAIDDLVETLIDEQRAPEDHELELLRNDHKTADIGMFGRMMASDPEYNTEAAVQVAHALSVHEADVEDDFFTAVDDLNTRRADAGAAHMGEKEFGAGLFYLYVCIDRDLLENNLQEDANLTSKALRALTECTVTLAPSGMQNSFGSRAYANYALAEKGDQQPRSLSVAYLDPVADGDYLDAAIDKLEATRDKMDACYGDCADARYAMNTRAGDGTLDELLDFVAANGSDA